MKKLIGRKVGMTQLFDEKGNVTGVTVIEAGPNYVTQVKTLARDGYNAVQLGFGEVRKKGALTRGELGHLGQLKANDKHPKRRALSGVPAVGTLVESRSSKPAEAEEGGTLKCDIFAVGDFVDVTGTMKGRGFAGNIKRHGFHRQKKTHGASDRERAPGSIGAGTTPGRVEKGQKMAGHYGNTRVTNSHLKVLMVDAERNLIAVAGSVPGANGGIVVIQEGRKQ
ncbi:MAG: 50S ribosomal protein L3 [Thermoflexales bacterium]|nr:50S ribosomal protein L3 [Thermoflexales bacterium]